MIASSINRSNNIMIDAGLLAQVVKSAIDVRVGMAPDQTHPDIFAREIGVDPRTLKGWRLAERSPELGNFLVLSHALGTEFSSRIMNLIGQETSEKQEVEINAPQTLADMTAVVSDMANRLSDGVFCHRDRAATAPALLEAAEKMKQQALAMMDEQNEGVVQNMRCQTGTG